MVLSNDYDSYYSCCLLRNKFGLEIGGFYSLQDGLYLNAEHTKNKEPIFVDLSVTRCKTFDNHFTFINNPESINPNIITDVYYRKYNGGTLPLLCSLYNRDLSKYSEKALTILLCIDGWYIGYYNKGGRYKDVNIYSLTQQLYAVASVPASVIGQGNIANVSEISLKLLFSQTDNKAKQMIQVLKEGMYKRFEYIRKLLVLQKVTFSDDIFDSLDVTFTVNRPVDTNNMMNELKTQRDMGAISIQTVIDKSPYTTNTALELQRIKDEQGERNLVQPTNK